MSTNVPPIPAPAHDIVYECPCGNLLPVPRTITVDPAAVITCALHDAPVPMKRYALTPEG